MGHPEIKPDTVAGQYSVGGVIVVARDPAAALTRYQAHQAYTPDAAEQLADAIARRRAEIDALLQPKLVATYNGHTFRIDDVSMARLNAALSIAGAVETAGTIWPGMTWTDEGNGLYQIPDLADLTAMIISLGQQGSAIYAAWQQHKFAVSQLTDVASVDAYDITVGWSA